MNLCSNNALITLFWNREKLPLGGGCIGYNLPMFDQANIGIILGNLAIFSVMVMISDEIKQLEK